MEEGKGGWEQDGRAQQQPTVVDRGCGRCGARTMLVGRRRARRRSQAGRSCTLSAAGVVSPLPLRRDSRASEGSPRPRGDRREQRGCHMPKRTSPPRARYDHPPDTVGQTMHQCHCGSTPCVCVGARGEGGGSVGHCRAALGGPPAGWREGSLQRGSWRAAPCKASAEAASSRRKGGGWGGD